MARGFSLIEILIAAAVGLLAIGAVLTGSFGSGSLLLDAGIGREAAAKALELIERERAIGRRDFDLVRSRAKVADGIFEESVAVELLPDYVTKLMTATVSWTGRGGRALSSALAGLVANLENVHAPNTCDSDLSERWENPRLSAPLMVDTKEGGARGNAVSDLDALQGMLYVATDNAEGSADDLYLYDIADSERPIYRGSARTVTARAGLAAVAVASTTAGRHAYVASAHDPNFAACTPGPNCSQLQVINVSDPTLSPPVPVTHVLLATSAPPHVLGNIGGGGSGQAAGKSVFYQNGYLYLGLTTTSNGPAFHVFDVGGGGAGSPERPRWVGSWPSPSPSFGSSGAPVNGIYVRGRYAYLAHPAGLVGDSGPLQEQITVLDVGNPSAPARVGSFYDSGGIGGNGKVIYPLGNDLFVGRTETSNAHPEFLMLDNRDPRALAANNTDPPGRTVGETVNGLVVRGTSAFVLSRARLEILDLSQPEELAAREPLASWTLSALSGLGANSTGNALECEGDYLYIGSETDDGAGVILVLSPGS